MEESTAVAEAVRADLRALASRTALVCPSAKACARCSRPLTDAPPTSANGGLPTGGCGVRNCILA